MVPLFIEDQLGLLDVPLLTKKEKKKHLHVLGNHLLVHVAKKKYKAIRYIFIDALSSTSLKDMVIALYQHLIPECQLKVHCSPCDTVSADRASPPVCDLR